jgi:protein disulfide-isomerase
VSGDFSIRDDEACRLDGLGFNGSSPDAAEHGAIERLAVACLLKMGSQHIETVPRRVRSINAPTALGTGFPVIIQWQDPHIAQMTGESGGEGGFPAAARTTDPDQNRTHQGLARPTQQRQGGGASQAIGFHGGHKTRLAEVRMTAKAKSKAENKPILINLTGSDWCGWCIKIEKDVFSQKIFQDFAAENLILMEADFPRKKQQAPELKKQNKALEDKYLNEGYPTIWLLDSEGNKLSPEDLGEFKANAEDYVKHLKELLAKTKAAK